MVITLQKEVRVVRELEGEPFYADTIPASLREAQEYAVDGGLVAPMPLLVEGFPHGQWLTANSEDHTGPGEFRGEKDHYVVTLHGGVDSGLILTPNKLDRALELYRGNEGGLTPVYAADLTQVFGKDVFADLLQGGMPSGESVDLFSFDQVLAGEHLDHLKAFKRFGVVRTLAQARETNSGYQEIDGNLMRDDEAVDSQVIAYTGGKAEAKAFLQRVKDKYSTGKVGVWHPFNNENFDPDIAEGRLLFLGDGISDGLGGSYGMDLDGRFVGVTPEALAAREKGELSDRVVNGISQAGVRRLLTEEVGLTSGRADQYLKTLEAYQAE